MFADVLRFLDKDINKASNVEFTQCQCSPGFDGSHCQNIIDICVEEPCYPNVNCTSFKNDTTIAAVCDNCPFGFNGNGRKCYGE